MSGGYYFRYIGNQTAVDNTLIGRATIPGRSASRRRSSADLPGGGGYPVCGLYDITVAARPLVQNNTTFARNFGGIVDHYQGYDFNATIRIRRERRSSTAA